MSKSTESTDNTLSRDLIDAFRYYLRGRRGLIVLTTIAIGGGLALNWNWLIATSIFPILLTILPCAVMCGLGLCGSKLAGKSCSSEEPVKFNQELPIEKASAFLPAPNSPAALVFHSKADLNISSAAKEIVAAKPDADTKSGRIDG